MRVIAEPFISYESKITNIVDENIVLTSLNQGKLLIIAENIEVNITLPSCSENQAPLIFYTVVVKAMQLIKFYPSENDTINNDPVGIGVNATGDIFKLTGIHGNYFIS